MLLQQPSQWLLALWELFQNPIQPKYGLFTTVRDCIGTRSMIISPLNLLNFSHLMMLSSFSNPITFWQKINLKHAYRSVPIHPANHQATGCKWHFIGDDFDTYFYDTRLPFGARSSTEIFHRLTQSVRSMMAKRGYHNTIVYLDVIGGMQAECDEAYHVLSSLLQDLVFNINQRKLVPSTCKLTFLGVELNTLSCTMTIPHKKLAECHALVSVFCISAVLPRINCNVSPGSSTGLAELSTVVVPSFAECLKT